MRRRYDKTVFISWLKRQDMNLANKELYKMYQEFTNETLSIQGFVGRIEKIKSKSENGKVTRICSKCHKSFKTVLDRTGYPLNNRCPACKHSEKKRYRGLI